MGKYKVILASRVDSMLLRHISFLARVSRPAAKRLRDEFGDIVSRLGENPFQFPVETDLNLPDGMYRGAAFAKRYKAIFTVEEKTVYIDAVIDCRQDTKSL